MPFAVSVEDQHLGRDSLPNPPNDVPQLQSDVVDDEDEDADADADDAEVDDADDNTDRPKLDEGFYEIEAIRRKRVRKVHNNFSPFSFLKMLLCSALLGI